LLYYSSLCPPIFSREGDEENHPKVMAKEILASQFVFMIKFAVTDYIFITENLKIVDSRYNKT